MKDIIIPQAGESVTSGVVLRWTKKVGDFVKRDETILELETDKATLEVPCPYAGVLKSQAMKEGDTVAIGASVGQIDETASAPAAASQKPVAVVAAATAAQTSVVETRATPLAKKTAEMLHVDLSKVPATGPGGRVREADVIGAAGGKANGSHASERRETHGSENRATANRNSTREKMTPIRMRIAQRLVQAQHTAAMLTTFNEVDMGPVMDLRKAYKEEFEKRHGVGLGFMSFFVKAAVQALRTYPMVNAFIVEEGGQMMIEKHDYCDISVAVSTPKGLVVPVIRNADRASMAGVEATIKDFGARGKEGKIALDEMQGGTFTITNGGVFGSLMSTPILNPPQSAILGMHAIKNRAVEYPAGSGQVAIRPMMYLALSYDHRIIDGAEAVQFLVKIKQCIEDPQRLLLDL